MTKLKKYVTINTEVEKKGTQKKIKKFLINPLTNQKKCVIIKVQNKEKVVKNYEKGNRKNDKL